MRSPVFSALGLILVLGMVPAYAQTPAPAPSATPAPATPAIPGSANPIVQTLIDALSKQIKAQMGWDDNRASGTVTYFRRFELQLRFDNGRYRDVHLHRGTVINPRGATIHEGNKIDVSGRKTSDGSLDADNITIH